MMRSIRGRFLLVSVLGVLLAVSLSGLAFVELFGRTLERRVHQELTDRINDIAGALGFADDGTLLPPDRTVDARFDRPYGGLYWQVEDDARSAQLRSTSLWDYALPLPEDEHEVGAVHRYHLAGPDNSDLLVQEQKILFPAPDGKRAVRVAAAIDASVVSEARRAFTVDLIPYLLALAVFLVAASLAQLTYGLRPVFSVSEGLNRIRERKAERLTGSFPPELQGVVDAVNRLLDAQADALSRARARAADLAHGLKTPLTILANDAETLKERGETEIGEELAHLATAMRAHVERELTRSRIAASAALGAPRADLSTAVQRIVRTLKRAPNAERLAFNVAVPQGSIVPLDQQDLEEMLGNILENATKWARSVVAVRLDGRILTIEDDGPGADPHGLARMTDRGVRLDAGKPGTGLGLAIVADIAAAYSLSVDVENRPEGGLRVTIDFSSANKPPYHLPANESPSR